MLRLSKKVEYAIIAISYIASKNGNPVSAKEIADNENISFEFLSKTLQSLMKKGLIVSIQGIKGGYTLNLSPDEINIYEIIFAIEDNNALVECFEVNGSDNCSREINCNLRTPMAKIQNEINYIFKKTKISDFINTQKNNLLKLEYSQV